MSGGRLQGGVLGRHGLVYFINLGLDVTRAQMRHISVPNTEPDGCYTGACLIFILASSDMTLKRVSASYRRNSGFAL